MPLFSNYREDQKIFFAHIPRTGGRSVTALFKRSNSFKADLCSTECETEEDTKLGFKPKRFFYKDTGIELSHLCYDHYWSLVDTASVPSFTVVRNPINRFLSYVNYWRTGKNSLISMLQSEQGVIEFFNEADFSLDIFLKPQWKYCNKKIKVWKYEDGLKDSFVNWLNKSFDLELKLTPYYETDLLNSLNLNYFPAVLENKLRQVYKWDFDYFNYN